MSEAEPLSSQMLSGGSAAAAAADDDTDGFELEPAGPVQQVSSYIAIIRIVAVLGMGLCMSLGLFLMLFGLRGVLVGVPLFLMVVPFYYGMRFAERLAQREHDAASLES